MADVAASANDPIFLNHHAMVDCIFETWLQNNPGAQYPQNNKIPQGHRQQDYIVPFFPLYTHQEMFSTADKFGYQCTIKSIQSSSQKWPTWKIAVIAVGVIAGLVISIVAVVIICVYYCRKNKEKQKTSYTKVQSEDTCTSDI